MLPVFIFIALPTLSLALLLAIVTRRLGTPLSRSYGHRQAVRRAMSRLEALQLLGLDDKADTVTIRKTYKRLMVQYHPDHGGSNQAAALLNLARDTLLRSRRSRRAA